MLSYLIIGILVGLVAAAIACYFIYNLIAKNQEIKFKLLSEEILKEKEKSFSDSATKELTTIINPIQEKITEYKQYLDSIHKDDLKDREGLREKINQMITSAQKIEVEAQSLTNALTSDVKFQGSWGELILEKVLELTGLEKDREYFTQEVLKDEDGSSYRPDMVIKLPGDSTIIIDSKVSLKAYFNLMEENQSDQALKELKKSVQTHVDQLSKKSYQNLKGTKSPDFTYLFIPVEGVYAHIIKEFPTLIDDALKKNIILVSPINLIANLKTVSSLWRVEKQSQNAELIAQKTGALYDKFALLIAEIEKMKSTLDRAQNQYDDIVKKLSTGKGNIISRVEEIKGLGAKTTKSISDNFIE